MGGVEGRDAVASIREGSGSSEQGKRFLRSEEAR